MNESKLRDDSGNMERQRLILSLRELREAIKKTKRGKEPGPDNVRMELIKWLDNEALEELLSLFNKWWALKTAPEELYYARVASIYKKGDTENAANYRPISFLSSFYKLYMIMIRERIQAEVEEMVTKTQYGFRPAKSTAHAIFIIRRIQEYAESTGEELYMTLLDWEKAFDKVDHKNLCKALGRLGIHQEIIDVLRDGYEKASFYVRDQFGKSEKKKQQSGIRQGCPLSPYLFVLVMTCIDIDIQQEISEKVRECRIPGADFDMVYYADDTIIVSKNKEAIEELIRLTESISAKYGLMLNKEKCTNLNINTEQQPLFMDGEKIEESKQAIYLGNTLNYKADPHAEVTQKIQEVNRTMWKLNDYWKASEASKKWKILIFDAVLKSKLLYGLETTQLPRSCKKRIDTFQLRS